MKKIGDITNTADKNGEFTDGNVAAGTPPTQLMGSWFNSVQREILNVLAKAGIPQSATKEDQLAEAITKMVASAGYLPTGYSYSKAESDAAYATKTALSDGLGLKIDKDSIVQSVGQSTTNVMSQYAVWASLQNYATKVSLENTNNALSNKFDKASVLQVLGDRTDAVVSQKVVKDEVNARALQTSLNATNEIVSRKLYISEALGVGQSWVDKTSERVRGTVYTNSTSKPIVVIFSLTEPRQLFTAEVKVGNVAFKYAHAAGNIGIIASATIIVPPGVSYSSNYFDSCVELR